MEHIIDLLAPAISVYITCYLLVIIAISIDLVSGVRKARQAGIARLSYGFRRTVDKAGKYLVCMLSLSVIDGFLIMGQIILVEKGLFTWLPLCPILVIIGGMYLSFIEFRSVFEKLEEKEKMKAKDDARVLAAILKNKELVKNVINLIQQIPKDETSDKTD